MSIIAIAKEFHVTKAAVRLKLKRHGINLRTMSEAQALVANYIELSESVLHFIDGLLLGDGCVFPNKHGLSAFYRHSDKNASYIKFLSQAFLTMGMECRLYHRDKISQLCSKSYRNFMAIRNRWYPEGTKKVPTDIVLKPITLLNWYIGDGSFHEGKNGTLKSERITIAMLYDEQGKDLLRIKLQEIDIANTSHRGCIYIKANSKQRFFDYMSKAQIQIPQCYKYKFPRRYYHDNEQS